MKKVTFVGEYLLFPQINLMKKDKFDEEYFFSSGVVGSMGCIWKL